jgi:hypothetical protein
VYIKILLLREGNFAQRRCIKNIFQKSKNGTESNIQRARMEGYYLGIAAIGIGLRSIIWLLQPIHLGKNKIDVVRNMATSDIKIVKFMDTFPDIGKILPPLALRPQLGGWITEIVERKIKL